MSEEMQRLMELSERYHARQMEAVNKIAEAMAGLMPSAEKIADNLKELDTSLSAIATMIMASYCAGLPVFSVDTPIEQMEDIVTRRAKAYGFNPRSGDPAGLIEIAITKIAELEKQNARDRRALRMIGDSRLRRHSNGAWGFEGCINIITNLDDAIDAAFAEEDKRKDESHGDD